MGRFILGIAAPAIALSAIGASSAAAQEDRAWRTVSTDEHCDIRFYREEMMVLMVRSYGRSVYSLSGEAFRMPETNEDVTGAIRVLAGESEVLLNGDAEAMQAQSRRTRTHPIVLFFAALQDQTAFTLETQRETQQIPLEGFDPAATEFENCVQALSQTGPQPPTLTSFEGAERLGAEASRQRLLSEKIGYTLTIDREGNVTDCELSRSFRRRAVTLALCRPFEKYAEFDPARDAQGNAVEGTFEIEIDFNMWMTQQGYLEAEDR